MNCLRLLILPVAAAVAVAANPPDFSGTWTFDPARSQNIGMMAQMEMTLTIRQTTSQLMEKIDATMMNQHQVQEVRLDLTGKPASNLNYMNEKSMTVSRWDGSRLVTTWTTPGAIPGTTRVSTETVTLKGNHELMVATSRPGKPDVVMIYRRK